MNQTIATEHTMGPWYPHRDMNYPIMGQQPYNQVWTVPEPLKGGYQIAKLCCPPSGSGSLKTYEANARLIASAPDMFEALLEIRARTDAKPADIEGIRAIVDDVISRLSTH